MNKRKVKVISLVLAIATILCVPTTAYAANKSKISDLSIYEQAELFAKERGLKLIQIDEATINDELKEIAYSYEGKGEKESGKTVEIEPSLIEPMGGSSADTAQRISVGSTVYDSIGAAAQVDWFVFKTDTGAGAYDIYTTGSTDVYGEIYKKTLFGYSLIDGDDDGGDGSNFRLEVGLNNNTDYYVKVRHYSTSGTGSYTLRVREHLDSTTSSNGGSWMWNTASPDPDGAFFNIDKLVYLTADAAEGYYIMLSRSDFHEVRDAIISLTYSAAVSYVMSWYKIGAGVAGFIVDQAFGFTDPDLTGLELDAIADAGNESGGQFANGIKIISLTTYTADMMPVMMNTYESWTGSTIYGQERYRGDFDLSDFDPMWR